MLRRYKIYNQNWYKDCFLYKVKGELCCLNSSPFFIENALAVLVCYLSLQAATSRFPNIEGIMLARYSRKGFERSGWNNAISIVA